MAGLIGASNSPISGVGILAALGIALVLLALFGHLADPAAGKALVAFALFVTALVFGVATISNDNLQDLKTGELVGATPWRQQVALVLGVVFGAVVIPPILTLLNGTFGFAGAPGAGPEALAAPQAALISAIIQGVLGQGLDWISLRLAPRSVPARSRSMKACAPPARARCRRSPWAWACTCRCRPRCRW
jgi:putative OPT family oligopeptide transporter